MQQKNWSRASMAELVDYIEQHHCEIRQQLQKVKTLLAGTDELPQDEHSAFTALKEFFPTLNTELKKHFAKEEQILIPYIRQMDDFSKNRGPKPQFQHSSIKNPISQLEYDHIQTEDVIFKKIHEITTNYHLPQNPSKKFEELQNNLKNLEAMISKHIDIEQNILFPWAIELELHIKHKK